jgi:hypothetical protein
MGRVESRSEIGFVCLPSHAQSAVGPGRQRNIQCVEIIGAGAAAGISDFYYPGQERTWTKTGQGWLTNVSLDGATFVLREFWPDINNALFHKKQ